MSLGSADAFEDRGEALATADAHGLQPVAGLAPVQFTRQGGQHASPGGADRVAQRDARAVDVGAVEIAAGTETAETPLAGDGEGLRGESLVELDEVDVVDDVEQVALGGAQVLDRKSVV